MFNCILRRLIQTIALLFLLGIILFALVNVAPGGPLSAFGGKRIRPEKIEILKPQFGRGAFDPYKVLERVGEYT